MAIRKKIFDITPPQKTQEPPAFAKASASKQKPKALRRVSKIQEVSVEKIISKKPFVFQANRPVLIAVGIVLVGALGFVFIKPKAEIEIWPVREPIRFTAEFSSIGEIVKKEQSFSQEFPATGKTVQEEKAQGVIKVYNNYHLDQILVQGTRFWCFEGKELREFKTKEKAVIGSQKNLDVQVIASSADEEYNIGPCTFSVPGLKGSPRYTAVYGESFSSMTGGKRIESSQVTREDLDKAETILKEKALRESLASVESSIALEDYIIIEEAAKSEVVEISPSAKAGQAVDNFSFQIKAEASVLTLKKSALKDFARQYLLARIPQGKELAEGSLVIGYLSESISFKNAEIILEIDVSAEIYSAIDEALLKEKAADKRPDEISAVFRNFPEINRAQTKLWPFWITKAPKDPARIKISVMVD